MNDHLKPKGYEKISWLKIAQMFPDKYEIVSSYDPKHDERLKDYPKVLGDKSHNDQADSQPGKRPSNIAEDSQAPSDAQTATPTAVELSALSSVFLV